jgi:phosphoadenosine phosphosulfate reductase
MSAGGSVPDFDGNFARAAEAGDPDAMIREAHARHGAGLVLSTSFGAQAEILLHRATRIVPEIPVIFVDTGYLFDETLAFGRDLAKRLSLNLHVYRPLRDSATQEAEDGRRWEQGDMGRAAYNLETKIEPMNRAMKELNATGWLAGLRRAQHDERRDLPYRETTGGGIVKYHPHLDMTDADVEAYRAAHDLPAHPLLAYGYRSIGDVHSTVPGAQHAFCGLHERRAAPRDLAGFDPII